jgi:tRNA pseudouridine55 synthase
LVRVTTDGVLVIDKPRGVTSHDVVRDARKLYGTRAVGHAGTLDPMATGVLVLVFGEATKLASLLTQDEKEYRATVDFGRSTDTLDAEGKTVSERPLPDHWLDETALAEAVSGERARTLQDPPVFSAISVGGVRAHRRARRGEDVTLEPRGVYVRSLEVVERRPSSLEFVLRVSKGYYVRAFARDVGARLGLPAHLSALVRLASGPFRIQDASAWPPHGAPPLMPLADAARLALPSATLTSAAVPRARSGQRLSQGDFVEAPAGPATTAWFDGDGRLVALGNSTPEGAYRVLRGFRANM